MPDQIFENPRLVEIYDAFDGERKDLFHYLAIAKELGAKSILDIGSGTGCLACLLSKSGFDISAVEPASASLDYAWKKIGAENVSWFLGDMTSLPAMKLDLAFMTGNVAQVFLTDEVWEENLTEIQKRLKTNAHFVFEVRDPAKKDWVNWNRKNSYSSIYVPNVGQLEGWCELTNVSGELVSFRWTYKFENGEEIISDSTLRFREREAIIRSLEKTGFKMTEVRDAPDRPGKEFVFIARTL